MLKGLANNSVLDDIFVFGYSDMEDGILHFNPDFRLIYFECDTILIRFESIEQYSKLKIEITSCMKYNFEIDEDSTISITSLRDLVLKNPMSENNKIYKLNLYNIRNKRDEIIVCDVLEIKLKNNQTIFLDSTFLSGIKVGGHSQKQFWIENMEACKKIFNVEEIII